MIPCAYCGGEHENIGELWDCGYNTIGTAITAHGPRFSGEQDNNWVDYVCPGCGERCRAKSSDCLWSEGVNSRVIANHIRNCTKYKLVVLAGGIARRKK